MKTIVAELGSACVIESDDCGNAACEYEAL